MVKRIARHLSSMAMKAVARRFLRMEAKPDICVLQNVAAVVGKDLFTDELRETLGQFEQAKNELIQHRSEELEK